MPSPSPSLNTADQPYAPVTPGAGRWRRLSDPQCARVEAVALGILERTGVRIDHPEVRALLARAGAHVDEADRARIPAALVREALAQAPKEIPIFDRMGRPAFTWGGEHAWFGPGSDGMAIVDSRTRERRLPVLADVERATALVDALPNMAFSMSLFLPSDVDGRIADRHQARIMLTGTHKPLIVVTYGVDGMRDVLEMAQAVAGAVGGDGGGDGDGATALAARPFAGWYINVTRGLLFGQDALERLLLLVDAGQPALWIPVTSGGTTGPVTLGGTLAVNHAGVLAGVVISQLRRPGAPIVVPGFGGDALDLRTAVDPYAGPDPKGAAEALAHHHGLPMFSLAGGSDSKTVDEQSVGEAALTILHDALAGGHVTHDSGYLESGLAGSLGQIAICDEIVSWTRASTAPVDLSDGALALDLVEALGVDGSFLEEDHTLERYRERWYPALLDRRTLGTWQAKGSPTLGERAADRVDAVLASHVPPPDLPPNALDAIDRIVARAEGELRP